MNEMTTEEMRDAFLDAIRSMIEYWEGVAVAKPRDRLEGLAHSILVLLDDGNDTLCSFAVIPYITSVPIMTGDIAGLLHERLFQKSEGKETCVEKILQHVKNLRDNYNFPAGIDALIKAYNEYEKASYETKANNTT